MADEMALNATIGRAQVDLELRSLEADLDDVYEEAFQDTDFEFLFDPRFDGIDESELAEFSSMANLRFEDWFTPFANVRYVHPYVAAAPPLRVVGSREPFAVGSDMRRGAFPLRRSVPKNRAKLTEVRVTPIELNKGNATADAIQ